MASRFVSFVAPLATALLAALAPMTVSTLFVLETDVAHAGEPREGGQIWATVLAQGGFGFVHPKLERVRSWLELQGRFRSFGESYELGMLPRVGLGYAITDQVTVTAGFAVVDNDPARAKPYTELRPWQQLVWNFPIDGFLLQSRTRLEQRIHQQNVGWRLRELVRLNAPVPGTDRVYLALWEEPFSISTIRPGVSVSAFVRIDSSRDRDSGWTSIADSCSRPATKSMDRSSPRRPLEPHAAGDALHQLLIVSACAASAAGGPPSTAAPNAGQSFWRRICASFRAGREPSLIRVDDAPVCTSPAVSRRRCRPRVG